jgi:hypothetical protein
MTRWRRFSASVLDDIADAIDTGPHLLAVDHAVETHRLGLYLLQQNDGLLDLLEQLDHLGRGGSGRIDYRVAEQNHKGLVVDVIASITHGVAEAPHLFLPDKVNIGQLRDAAHRLQFRDLSLRFQLGLDETAVEMLSMERLPAPMIMTRSVMPAWTASSTTYWITGVSTIGSISFGCDFVAGRKRVPNPAAGMTALRIIPWRFLSRGRSRV